MNQFKEWGFSTQWWRGEKGEYWVLGQTVLSVGFVLLPVYPAIFTDLEICRLGIDGNFWANSLAAVIFGQP